MVNDYLIELLMDRYPITTSFERELIREAKEKHCYVGPNADYFDTNLQSDRVQYQLPDKSYIEIGREQYMCPESLFNTTLVGRDGDSV